MAICLMEKKMENTWTKLIGKKIRLLLFLSSFFYWLGSKYFDGVVHELCCHAMYRASSIGLR